ncbi:helix-turn-helix domain-containing protein [Candidatus Falkowbacteria bacterium]|nr:helix-turn-helix domain-containing protein [Candidatus Falkowbacteria bacterium]
MIEAIKKQYTPPANPIWLSVSEAAKLGGVQTKTIRRAIQANAIKYKVVKNRYLIDFVSIITYLRAKTKLKNKFNAFGIGKYVDKWKGD